MLTAALLLMFTVSEIEMNSARIIHEAVLRLFRGNTLINISPRDEGTGYALYQRDFLRRPKAPMQVVERYIAPVLPRW